MSNQNADPDPWDDPLWYARYRDDPRARGVAPRQRAAQPGEGTSVISIVVVAAAAFLVQSLCIQFVGWAPGLPVGAALSVLAHKRGGPWLEWAVIAAVVVAYLLPLLLFTLAHL
ncbi:MAG: hypothetical protein S0880_29700 [Actinomycetota bacterium]|nr:hypothetical protein [Actinomycetota bacterium]